MNNTFFDLSARAKLRVTGSDRERFLNGQLTNDVRKASNVSAIEACILNARGKLNAYVFVGQEGESFLVDADSELRESLPNRLERYIIADDVRVEDASDRLSIFHVLCPRAPVLPNEFKIRSIIRFAASGYDVWSDAEQRDELLRQLSEKFAFCDNDCTEVFRIEKGIPRWGRELTEEIIPVEANLEEGTIDYEKGCYIGQEVISRMKMSGQTNKRLCGLVSLHDSPLLVGMKLFPAGGTEKDVGWITSACRSERLGKEIALGFVKRGFNPPATRLEAVAPAHRAGSIRVEIVDLPFNSPDAGNLAAGVSRG